MDSCFQTSGQRLLQSQNEIAWGHDTLGASPHELIDYVFNARVFTGGGTMYQFSGKCWSNERFQCFPASNMCAMCKCKKHPMA